MPERRPERRGRRPGSPPSARAGTGRGRRPDSRPQRPLTTAQQRAREVDARRGPRPPRDPEADRQRIAERTLDVWIDEGAADVRDEAAGAAARAATEPSRQAAASARSGRDAQTSSPRPGSHAAASSWPSASPRPSSPSNMIASTTPGGRSPRCCARFRASPRCTRWPGLVELPAGPLARRRQGARGGPGAQSPGRPAAGPRRQLPRPQAVVRGRPDLDDGARDLAGPRRARRGPHRRCRRAGRPWRSDRRAADDGERCRRGRDECDRIICASGTCSVTCTIAPATRWRRRAGSNGSPQATPSSSTCATASAPSAARGLGGAQGLRLACRE